MTLLHPHPDRLFPADPSERDARAAALRVRRRRADLLAARARRRAPCSPTTSPFRDPAALLITPDHYVLRLLHAVGVPLDELGLRATARPRPHPAATIWRRSASTGTLFLGTPVRFWFETELHDVFGLTEQPSAANADDLYDQLVGRARAATSSGRARCSSGSGIDVLATTDDPADDLAAHHALRDDPTFAGRVLPTFRADRYMDPSQPGWAAVLDRLAGAPDVDTSTYARAARRPPRRAAPRSSRPAGRRPTPGVLGCRQRRRSTPSDAERIHAAALRGDARRRGRRRLPAQHALPARRDVGARTAWSCSCTPA